MFGKCCGTTKRDRKPPVDVIVKRRFLSSTICDRLVDHAKAQSGEQLLVGNKPNAKLNDRGEKRSRSIERESESIPLGAHADAVVKLLQKVYAELSDVYQKAKSEGRGANVPLK